MPRPLHELETLSAAAYRRLEEIRNSPEYRTRKNTSRHSHPQPIPDADRPDCPFCEAPHCLRKGWSHGIQKWGCRICKNVHCETRRDFIRQEIAAGRMDTDGNAIIGRGETCPKCESRNWKKHPEFKDKGGTYRQNWRCLNCKTTYTIRITL